MANLLNLYIESLKDVWVVFAPPLIGLAVLIFSTAIIFRFTPQNIKSRVSDKLQVLRTQSDSQLIIVGYGYVIWLSFILGFVFSAFGREDLASNAFTLFGITIGAIVFNTIVLHIVKWVIGKKD